MKKLVFLFLLMPVFARAMCLEFYFDKDGQSHSIQCGSNRPEAQCYNGTYWNGEACEKIEIIKICEEQGGQWEQAQLRGAHISEALEPDTLRKRKAIIHMCVCPDKKVWDGRNCRSDIPLANQCTTFFGDGTIRMTEEFFGSKNCSRILK
ncbi:MAG: hypothetical protein IKS41_06880 [Alphaproteobacteria bacterium]|nr:hypothetical protein [Alphaproteobacteria bacterium]